MVMASSPCRRLSSAPDAMTTGSIPAERNIRSRAGDFEARTKQVVMSVTPQRSSPGRLAGHKRLTDGAPIRLPAEGDRPVVRHVGIRAGASLLGQYRHQGAELFVGEMPLRHRDRVVHPVFTHSGMFPCFLGGRASRLVRSRRKVRMTEARVSCG